MEEALTQLRKGSLELAVLALLDPESRYGVELIEELAARPGLQASSGTIYPLLTRLKNSGLVSTEWRESPVGPPRKYYSLTAAGRAQLSVQRDAWRLLSSAMETLLKETA
ncbi:MAG: PadR family transcriptional regulator [Brooklawnia sp.]|jgi:PadR family transcriptional regulator PadR